MTVGCVCELTFKEVRQMDDKAQLIVEGKTYELPILTGSEGERRSTSLPCAGRMVSSPLMWVSRIQEVVKAVSPLWMGRKGSSDIGVSLLSNWQSIQLLWRQHTC